MSSSQPQQLACGGRRCPNCGKCHDWNWEKGSSGCCGIGAKEAEWTRIGRSCRYGPRKVFHDTLGDSSHHSLCVCKTRRKQ
jgi:hypothetical protein